MITREEYNKALDIVEEYQRQIFNPTNKEKRILIDDFMQENKYEMSVRLFNSLKKNSSFTYLDEISSMKPFLTLRDVGKKTWWEFSDLLHSKGYETKK